MVRFKVDQSRLFSKELGSTRTSLMLYSYSMGFARAVPLYSTGTTYSSTEEEGSVVASGDGTYIVVNGHVLWK